MTAPIEIEIWQGEMADLEVDALVVPATESLFMTNPVAASVKRQGGDVVERAAIEQGPIRAGTAIVTTGGGLAAPWVIHAVAVGHDLRADADRLRSGLRAALGLAASLGLRRIAMAPLGIERGVFGVAEAAALTLEELRAYDRGPSGLPQEVVIALAGPREAAVFMATAQGLRAAAG
jgi:O-acetyl-ADP-ribose deacetylase (regulator of RNase III)